MARVESPLPKTYHEQAGEFMSVTRSNAIINANKEQFDAIALRSSLVTVFLVVISTRTRELTSNRRTSSGLWKSSHFNNRTKRGDSMFHHVLSTALSTVFDLAFVILPAAPLFAVKTFSSSAGPGQEQDKQSAPQRPGAGTANSA